MEAPREPTRTRTASEDYALDQQAMNRARQDIRGKALSGLTSATSDAAQGALKRLGRAEWESQWSSVGKNITTYESAGKLPHGISQLFNKYNELFISCGYDKATSALHREKHEVRQELLKEMAAAKGLDTVAEMEVIKNHLLAENEEFVGKIIGEKYGTDVEALYDQHRLTISRPNNPLGIIQSGLALLNAIDALNNRSVTPEEKEFIRDTILKRLEKETPFKVLDEFSKSEETPASRVSQAFGALLSTDNEALWNAAWNLFNNFTESEHSPENTRFIYLCHAFDQLDQNQPLSEVQKQQIATIFSQQLHDAAVGARRHDRRPVEVIENEMRVRDPRPLDQVIADPETFGEKIQTAYIDSEVVNLSVQNKLRSMAQFPERTEQQLRDAVAGNTFYMTIIKSSAQDLFKAEKQEIEARVTQELEAAERPEKETPAEFKRRLSQKINEEFNAFLQIPENAERLQKKQAELFEDKVSEVRNVQNEHLNARANKSTGQLLKVAYNEVEKLYKRDTTRRMSDYYLSHRASPQELIQMNACLYMARVADIRPPPLPLPPTPSASSLPGTPTTTPPPSPPHTGSPPPFEEAA